MTCSRPKALSEVDGNLAHRASERWVGGSLSCQYTLWNLRFLGLIRKREEKLAVFGF